MIRPLAPDAQPIQRVHNKLHESGVPIYRSYMETPEGAVLHYDLVMSWAVDDPGDTIVVDGSPPIRVELPDGYHGDLGTTAEVVNAIGRYNQVAPGFYRSIDLPLRFS